MKDERPRIAPLREFVLKVASRCNLACDYCYVYTGPDQSWRHRPRVMSTATVDAAAARIGAHMRDHRLENALIALHGGEPLLAGVTALEKIIASVRRSAPAGARVDVVVQTNGLLLDEAFLRMFARHAVRVGISLDGSRQGNDRHRKHADGRSSYPGVVQGLRLLDSAPYRRLFAGILCTIDIANDPVATYRSLLEFGPPTVDFLLPHANWSQPPARPPGTGPTPYADWLIAVFDEWYAAPGTGPDIRLFDEVIHLLLGGAPHTEFLGGAAPGFAIVETDGTIEGMDSLKSAYQGAAATGMSVHTHSFDEARRHPVTTPGPRHGALAEACRSCPVLRVCGGGQYAHRYRAGHGFRNPSVYCADLRRLIEHIAGHVLRDLSRAKSR